MGCRFSFIIENSEYDIMEFSDIKKGVKKHANTTNTPRRIRS